MQDTEKIQLLANSIKKVKSEIGKVIIGQNDIIDQLLTALFAKGHVLLIGVPGLAKTLLIRTLSKALDLKFSRIQFTPDLMPGDISGTEIIEDNLSSGQKTFRFVKGPIFANIVLADEINRTPPKTQAALLEAMEEHAVTAAGITYTLDEPFFVLATQNPIEQEGTYPLPEAQLDRFMYNIWLDYPSLEEEINIVKSTTSINKPKVEQVLTATEIMDFQELVRKVPVSDNVIDFAVKLVRNSRPETTDQKFVKDFLSYGAGPRASQYIILGAKSNAALHGKFTPDIDDVKASALPVLRHRIVPNFNAEADNVTANEIIRRLVESVK
ncbi:MAG: MoxR family ATPase [Candidatus Kapabacteria bacterium]|nr:MoxR family ATPase [Ignavibacteriota bacterium]MCW5884370.1 MoxR family ATPase [Candidatus Kapabacteria bacterium]